MAGILSFLACIMGERWFRTQLGLPNLGIGDLEPCWPQPSVLQHKFLCSSVTILRERDSGQFVWFNLIFLIWDGFLRKPPLQGNHSLNQHSPKCAPWNTKPRMFSERRGSCVKEVWEMPYGTFPSEIWTHLPTETIGEICGESIWSASLPRPPYPWKSLSPGWSRLVGFMGPGVYVITVWKMLCLTPRPDTSCLSPTGANGMTLSRPVGLSVPQFS